MSGMMQRRLPLMRCALAAAGFAGIGLFAVPGHAQPYVWGWGGYWERPAPRYYYAPDYDDPAPERPYGAVPIAVIRQRIADAGFHLVAQPKRRGNIYLAAAEDRRGQRHRLVYDAATGNLIESAVIQAPKPVTKPPVRPTDETHGANAIKPAAPKPEPAKVAPDTALPKPSPVAVPAAPPPATTPASSSPEPASTSVAVPEKPAPSTPPVIAAPETVAPMPTTPSPVPDEPK